MHRRVGGSVIRRTPGALDALPVGDARHAAHADGMNRYILPALSGRAGTVRDGNESVASRPPAAFIGA